MLLNYKQHRERNDRYEESVFNRWIAVYEIIYIYSRNKNWRFEAILFFIVLFFKLPNHKRIRIYYITKEYFWWNIWIEHGKNIWICRETCSWHWPEKFEKPIWWTKVYTYIYLIVYIVAFRRKQIKEIIKI